MIIKKEINNKNNWIKKNLINILNLKGIHQKINTLMKKLLCLLKISLNCMVFLMGINIY